MSDSFIAVTPGSGANVDTRTESSNSNHRQVFVVGDPSTNTGVAPVDGTNGLSVTLTTAIPAGSNVVGGVKESPDATSTFCPTNTTSSAYEASRVIKSSAGVLYSIVGYNSKTSTQFIQIHDATSLPIENSLPKIIFTVPASSNFYYSSDKFGRYFVSGVVVCNSSTGPYKTIGSADCWYDAQYS